MLLEQYEQPLYGYLLVLVGSVEVAHDCVQDTFVRAFEHLRKGKMINQQWLYKVARNRAMDYFRQGQ
jgi:DNA-directed RNA polymerase specialized sigma24 family protein